MNLSVSYYSAIGGRKKNEDTVTILENGNTVIGIAADGLGGHSGGDIASKIAARVINAKITNYPISVYHLREAITAANEKILRNTQCPGMKTTVAVLWLDRNDALAANIGDTRIYQFRNFQILYQSKDHTVAQMSVMIGELAPEELRRSKERHRLTRALGVQEDVKADVRCLDVQPGDAFLLCSDGFWERIGEDMMISALQTSQTASEWLKSMRNFVERSEEPPQDNHSAIAIIVGCS